MNSELEDKDVMEEGLFETLVTAGLAAELARLSDGLRAQTAPVGDAEQAEVLARHLRHAVMRRLYACTAEQRVGVLNDVLRLLDPGEDPVVDPPAQLNRVARVDSRALWGSRMFGPVRRCRMRRC
ncbi:MAG: hypothetical protein ACRDP8_24490 [Actinopolymorphaceae bacterium]